MTDAKSNYGTRLKSGSALVLDVGEVISIDPPEIINEPVEATSMSSGGWREVVSGGLKEVAEFSATINFTDTYVSTIYSDVSGSVSKLYQIQFPDDGSTKWTFNAFVTSLKPLSADAQSPEALQAEVKFQPSGSMTVS
jgi:hypothetical protein